MGIIQKTNLFIILILFIFMIIKNNKLISYNKKRKSYNNRYFLYLVF